MYPSIPFDVYRVTLKPLSPIHVGSGEVLDPCEYKLWIDEENRAQLDAFNLDQILAHLNEQDHVEFDRRLDGNYADLRAWLRGRADRHRHLRFSLSVQPAAFSDLKEIDRNSNRLEEIHLFPRLANTQQVYLPGSSVKGAIRTAIVDALTKTHHNRVPPYDERRFEPAMLNYLDDGSVKIQRDPFRQYSLSDFQSPYDPTYIDRIEIIKQRNASQQSTDGIRIFREVTWSMLEEVEFEFEGELRFRASLADNSKMQGNPLEPLPAIRELCRQVNDFYIPRLEDESRRFRANSDVGKRLLYLAGQLTQDECLIRLGRHSHFECVTVGPDYRNPPRRGCGSTRSYVNGQLPLGWAQLSFKRA